PRCPPTAPLVPYTTLFRSVDRVDLGAQVLRVEIGRTGPVVRGPLCGQVEGDLRVVVGDEHTAGDVDDGGHADPAGVVRVPSEVNRKSTRLNSSHVKISYAVFCLKKKMIAEI